MYVKVFECELKVCKMKVWKKGKSKFEHIFICIL